MSRPGTPTLRHHHYLALLFYLTILVLQVSCASSNARDIVDPENTAARTQRIRDSARAWSHKIRGKQLSPQATELQSFRTYDDCQSEQSERELAEQAAELQALDVKCHNICQRVLRRMFPSKTPRRQADICRIQHCPMTIAGPCGMGMKDVRTSAMSTPSYASYGFSAKSPFSLSSATLDTADLPDDDPRSITQHLAQRNVWDHIVPKGLRDRASEAHQEQPSDIFFFGPYYSHTGRVKTIGRLPVGMDQRKLQRQTAIRRPQSQRLPAAFFESPYDTAHTQRAQGKTNKTAQGQDLPRLSYSKAV